MNKNKNLLPKLNIALSIYHNSPSRAEYINTTRFYKDQHALEHEVKMKIASKLRDYFKDNGYSWNDIPVYEKRLITETIMSFVLKEVNENNSKRNVYFWLDE